MEKKHLRTLWKQHLLAMDRAEKKEKEEAIRSLLYEQPCWTNAQTIAITISLPTEICTYRIVERAWCEGKRVAVPKCDPITKTMTFRIIRSFADVERSSLRLYEPIEERTAAVDKQEIDLLFVPGLAFTQTGYRLGYGGGYYDRYLTNFFGMTLALAFAEQVVSHLPIEAHDLPVQMIVTNEKVIDCEGEKKKQTE